jgi:hypothetical protein
MHETAADVSPHATAHEETDVNVRALNTFMIWLVVSLAIVGLLVFWQYRRFENKAVANDPPPSPRADERAATPGPGLQIDELTEGLQHTAAQQAKLHQTGWVSRNENLVRIPIERAMEMVTKDGLPNWPAPAASPTEPASPALK